MLCFIGACTHVYVLCRLHSHTHLHVLHTYMHKLQHKLNTHSYLTSTPSTVTLCPCTHPFFFPFSFTPPPLPPLTSSPSLLHSPSRTPSLSLSPSSFISSLSYTLSFPLFLCPSAPPSLPPSQVMAITAHENMNMIAVGYKDGTVILIRGNITRDRMSRHRIVHQEETPRVYITGKGVGWRCERDVVCVYIQLHLEGIVENICGS